MRRFFYITIVALAMSLSSCFKETVDYTRFNLMVQEQNIKDGEFAPASHLESYVYYADTTYWRIADYEAAVECRLTNKKTGEQRTQPDVVASAGLDEAYPISLELREQMCLMVIVDREHKIYALRQYKKPENLADVYTKLYIATWRPTHSASGWSVINEFYQKEETE